jgi:2-oxoglutarate dehydrogenase E1 component
MSERMQRFTYATGTNAQYIEEQYARFKVDPSSVDEQWKKFFEGYEFALATGPSNAGIAPDEGRQNALVEAFINAYRRLGHLSAHLDPLNPKPEISADMLPEAHGLAGVRPDQVFHTANLPDQDGKTFAEIHDLLKQTYCGRIGAEFREVDDIEIVKWFQLQMEGCRNQPQISADVRKRLLDKLTESEGFEKFLHARYLGQQRFSLEGAESFVPLLDVMINEASREGVEEVCIGMAHRGRLNTLANIMQKSPELIFKEFEGTEFKPFDIDGDVKYHKGFASEVATFSGAKMRLYLSPNPSHLEAVNPVVEGFVRARQRLLGDANFKRVLPLLVHGDASFIGQGLVAETLNLSQLPYYKTGGTIHVIINNQVGFTTPPEEGRSCTYSSGIAQIIRAPVLHVNADDPEAVAWCAMLATAYRQKFGRDIVIDLVGYRRHGHNETDEPGFTQPVMYKKIAAHPTVLSIYSSKLVALGVVSQKDVDTRVEKVRADLQAKFEAVRAADKKDKKPAVVIPVTFQKAMNWREVSAEELMATVKTGVSAKTIREVGQKITSVPSGFSAHSKVVRLLENRVKMLDGKGAVDWAFAELLAFGTLAKEGHHVRLSGQDCQRGTFSSRHGVIRDFETGTTLHLLNQIAPKQAPVDIINSPLSEQGVMGFDFGYSVADPDSLVLWEGQFGDFVNGAQIIIDQFLVASEAKWKQVSGLTLLLPHGYEGQGPEHSSARPERFLQLCGNLNIQVAIPTTPSQYFHILRRQLHRDFRKPLVLMTPKSLLRHPKVISTLADFESDGFREVLDDSTLKDKDCANAQRLVFCTGKIFYELSELRAANEAAATVPIMRIEQLYPFPEKMLKSLLARYPKVKEVIWTQEEPQNMGAWTFVRPRLIELLPASATLRYVGRKGSGTTAEGSTKAHEAEQKRIINEALGLTTSIRSEATAIY